MRLRAHIRETARVRLTAYDLTKPLIIDPVLEYSTYLGGSNDRGITGFERSFERGNAIAVDAYGNAYVTGSTLSASFPIKNAYQATLKNRFGNAFVTKLCPAGNALVYSTYLGGSRPQVNELVSGDQAFGIAVDARGNAYVTGEANSADFPLQNAFQKILKSSNGNAFVTKLCPAGNALVYSTFLGGSNDDEDALGIAVDPHGNAYITGHTNSDDFPTQNAFQKTLGFGGDAFVTKFCPAGTLVYSSYLGGGTETRSGNEEGRGIAVDAHGEAYVTGFTNSADFPTKNAFQPMPGGPFATNAFVTKISAH